MKIPKRIVIFFLRFIFNCVCMCVRVRTCVCMFVNVGECRCMEARNWNWSYGGHELPDMGAGPLQVQQVLLIVYLISFLAPKLLLAYDMRIT